MNIIDKIIEPFNPVAVANRIAARMAIQAYDAARQSRTHKAKGEPRSADGAVKVSAKSLRDQARDLDANHDIVTGLFDRLEERVVGAKGIGVEPLPLNIDGTVNRDLMASIKRAWGEWSVSPETSGEHSRAEMERLICRTWLRDGEMFAQHIHGTVPSYQYLTAVQYALEILEPDYCPISYDDSKAGIAQGIERNAWRRVRGYHVFKEHPADSTRYNADTKFIKASEMLHVASRKRIGQSRGVSILHSVIIRLADLKDYEESERVAARIAAALTMFIKKGDPGLYANPGEGVDEKSGLRNFSLGPGMIFDGLAPGEDVGMLESNRPSALLEGFRDAMLRAVASGTRLGSSTLSKNYNGTYSAQRQELVEAQSGYEVLQDSFISQWSRPVYRKWLDVAIRTGKIKIPPGVDLETIYNAVYMAPVMPWIDPAKESKAWKELVAGGFATESEVVRARGKDPAELKAARIAEVKENRESELVFESDAYHKHYAQEVANETENTSDGDSGGDSSDDEADD